MIALDVEATVLRPLGQNRGNGRLAEAVAGGPEGVLGMAGRQAMFS
ncbi:MAG TPA: hypothetical protein VGA56_21375 [Opitutaceae bacterium]